MSFIFLLGWRSALFVIYLVGFIIGGLISSDDVPSNMPDYKLKRLMRAFFWPVYLVMWFFRLILK